RSRISSILVWGVIFSAEAPVVLLSSAQRGNASSKRTVVNVRRREGFMASTRIACIICPLRLSVVSGQFLVVRRRVLMCDWLWVSMPGLSDLAFRAILVATPHCRMALHSQWKTGNRPLTTAFRDRQLPHKHQPDEDRNRARRAGLDAVAAAGHPRGPARRG